MKTQEEIKKTKLITNPAIARKLIQKGFKIVDIKPNRDNHLMTVFAFENSPELQSFLKQYQKL